MQYCDVITNPRWRTAAILKIAFLAITHRLIVQFRRNFVCESRTVCRQRPHDKTCIFLKSKMADGCQKIVISPYLCKNRPILMKFGTVHQILNPVTVTWPKIEIFGIQDGGDRHLENRFFGHNSSTDCLILAKFCMRKQNGIPTKATWQKLQAFKIQNGGRPPFWKSLNYHYLSENIVGFWQNLVYYSMYWTWWGFQKRYCKILDVIR